ncbi:unnamed protein product, partial [Medioppia subpectinata]
MGRPTDRYGFIRPPVVSTDDQLYEKPQDHWFDQRLDHFNKTDDRTFKQLYYVYNDTHYKPGGPVFLFLFGENAMDEPYTNPNTYWLEMAKKYNALAIMLEHRYYGRSVPTPDLSTQNLKYLTLELALKDAEQFILGMTKKLSIEGSKWVVWGLSYSGKLAVWFREKYPNLTVGAIASSAPVGSTNNCTGYLRVAAEVVGKECSDNIRKANYEMEDLLKTPEGVVKLRKILNLCDSFDGKNIDDIRYLAQLLAMNVGGSVQYKAGIDYIIKHMNDPSGGTPLERYASLHVTGQTVPCNNIKHADYIKILQNTTVGPNSWMRPWSYQQCTSFADFVTSDLPNSPFGHNIPVEFYTKQCTQIFGLQITAQTIQKAVDRTVATYGGKRPNITNVVLTNGSLDPWKASGILEDLNNSTKTAVIEGGAHCDDFWGTKPTDNQIYCEPNLGFKTFMGRPTDRYGFIRPPVVSNNDKFAPQPQEQWFDQRVDHFNKQDNTTFKQLYYIEDSYYKKGGPVFLMISGESPVETAFITPFTYMGEMAKKYGALAVTLEHRYYGKSVPTPDLSTQNLKYLTLEVALKDLEQFSLYLTKKLSLDGSKWVVFGGSYAGKLAAWFREKYPNIAVGAIASSAPVGSNMNCTGYLRVVSEALGKECSDNIRKANYEMEDLLKTPEGVVKLRKTLNLCDSFDGKNIDDIRYLAQLLGMNVAGAVQNNMGIDQIIKHMNDPSGGTPLERYASLHVTGQTVPCNNIKHADYIKSLQNTTVDHKSWCRQLQWTYQTCTSFADFPTTELANSPFGHNVPVEYYVQQCGAIFGPQITGQSIKKAVDRTVATYGGLKPNVTNVVFPNGALDPWKAS